MTVDRFRELMPLNFSRGIANYVSVMLSSLSTPSFNERLHNHFTRYWKMHNSQPHNHSNRFTLKVVQEWGPITANSGVPTTPYTLAYNLETSQIYAGICLFPFTHMKPNAMIPFLNASSLGRTKNVCRPNGRSLIGAYPKPILAPVLDVLLLLQMFALALLLLLVLLSFANIIRCQLNWEYATSRTLVKDQKWGSTLRWPRWLWYSTRDMNSIEMWTGGYLYVMIVLKVWTSWICVNGGKQTLQVIKASGVFAYVPRWRVIDEYAPYVCCLRGWRHTRLRSFVNSRLIGHFGCSLKA